MPGAGAVFLRRQRHPRKKARRTNETFEVVRTEDPFTRINNKIFLDKRLNLKTLGLLCLCLSLPDDWNFSIRGLVSISGAGQAAIISALDTLQALGYLRRDQDQTHQASGKFGSVRYVFFDTPQKKDEPCVGFPYTDEPYTEKPCTDNPPQERIKQETKKQEKPPISPVKEKLPLPKEVMERIESYAGPDLQLRDALLHFAINRKEIRKPIKTQHAMTLLLTTLDKKSEGDRALKLDLIREAEEKNWLTFYRHDDRRGAARSPTPKPERFEPEVSAWQ